MKIITVLGARPQFIKAAAVSRAFRERKGIDELLVHTGQHYDDNLSDIFFRELGLARPDYNLGIGSGAHSEQTGRMLDEVGKVIAKESPDLVLVYGDTNSTLAGALAAAKLNIPVAHVEAGLRSFNRNMPEEINRVLTDHASDYLFVPTTTAYRNLENEGLGQKAHVVGDVMYDAALTFGAIAEEQAAQISTYNVEPGGYVLATVHRAENTDDKDRLANIFEGLIAVSGNFPVIIPLHPRTRLALERNGLLEDVCQNLKVIHPLGYLDMLLLEKNSRLIVTDSGGIQKEAYFFSVPCVTLRDETEWVELVEMGWNKVVSPQSSEEVSDSIMAVINSPLEVSKQATGPYGDGHAAENIAELLSKADL